MKHWLGCLPRPLTDGVVVSQVVPNYQSDSSDVVGAYNRLIAERGETPSFTSLEGYISARIFIAGLLEHKVPFTPDKLIHTWNVHRAGWTLQEPLLLEPRQLHPVP